MGANSLRLGLGIVLLIVALATPQSAAQAANPLSPGAACRLAGSDKIDSSVVYSIFGTYFADGRHGALLELPGCGQIIFPEMGDAPASAIGRYHASYSQRCRGVLIGDHITGVFTGTFIRRRARLYGMPAPMPANFFEIRDIRTKDLDPSSIHCAR